ncbi:MAG: TRAP transporter small permease subunit [Ignavibacteriaceae bacterium]|jgi:TRAP-type mannitol/chloroaromatic compound transport system permease small subunit
MKFINIYINFIDKLNDKIGSITSWLTALLVLVVSYDVIVRYLVEESSVGLQEFEWHLFALIFLLSAAYTLKIDDHVRVDVFYTKFSPRKQAWINFLGSILFLIPFCIVVIIASQDFVSLSFRINETSPDAGGLPARFILKAFIPISFFLLLLQGIALVFKSFLKLKEKD